MNLATFGGIVLGVILGLAAISVLIKNKRG